MHAIQTNPDQGLALTTSEAEARAHHESVVDSVIGGISHLSQIGDASLKVLRDQRLYRSTHETFEGYCQERFGITRSQANRRLAFSAILEGLAPRGAKLPATERQARPLAKLPTPELQAEAWTAAQATTVQEQPSARAVAAEVEALQARLAKTEQRSAEWKAQALTEKKQREEAEAAARLKAKELSTLRQSVEQTAERLANDRLAEVRAEAERATLDKLELEAKLKTLRKDQEAAVESRTRQALQAQQDEINHRESQLQALETRIATLNARLVGVSEQDRVMSHFEGVTKEIHATLVNLKILIEKSFDRDYVTWMPQSFTAFYYNMARDLEEGGVAIRDLIDHQVEVRPIEVPVHE